MHDICVQSEPSSPSAIAPKVQSTKNLSHVGRVPGGGCLHDPGKEERANQGLAENRHHWSPTLLAALPHWLPSLRSSPMRQGVLSHLAEKITEAS